MLRFKAHTKNRHQCKYTHIDPAKQTVTSSDPNINEGQNSKIKGMSIKTILSLFIVLVIAYLVWYGFQAPTTPAPVVIIAEPSLTPTRAPNTSIAPVGAPINIAATSNSTCTSIQISDSLKQILSHQENSYRPYNQTCVCCQQLCGIWDKSKVIGARLNINESNFDLYPKIIDLFNSSGKYGPIKKISNGAHISFEYFCCLSTEELLIADRFLKDIYDGWIPHKITFNPEIQLWPRKNSNEAVMFVIEPDYESQVMLFEWVREFECKFLQYLKYEFNYDIKYQLPFQRATVYHSSLLWVDPRKYDAETALKHVNEEIGKLLSKEYITVEKACWSRDSNKTKWKDFHCID